MNLKEIVKSYLLLLGFNGLVHVDTECGCEIDDLFACDNPNGDCEPAYQIECKCGECYNRGHMISPDALKENMVCWILSFAGIDIEWRYY